MALHGRKQVKYSAYKYSCPVIQTYASESKPAYRNTRYNLIIFPSIKVSSFNSTEIAKRSFQYKIEWFRCKVYTHRISWREGREELLVDRHNLEMTTKEGLAKVNLHKYLKIIFNDEDVNDAGGLLRYWMHLTLKEIFHPERNGNLALCDSDETYYKFKESQNPIEKEVAKETFKTLGLIIGKALFERVSLNCLLNHTIWRQICCQPIQFEDIYSYDRSVPLCRSQLYQSWKMLLTEHDSYQWGLTYAEQAYDEYGDPYIVELEPGGNAKSVNELNKNDYLQKLIAYRCEKQFEDYFYILRLSIYRTISPEYLKIFLPIELEMLLNGPQEISVEDWQTNTVYKNYTSSHEVTQWFWEYVRTLGQEKLSNLLHYVTGSVKVPIRGFRYLESNRNQIAQFTIEREEYSTANPYPKAHTCFNRLNLPCYTTKQELFTRMQDVLSSELNNFGLD